MTEDPMPPNEPSGTDLPGPYALSMMICDSISIELGTAKTTLHGCFGAISAPDFPVSHHQMALYIAMTNGHGQAHVKVQLVDSDGQNDPLFVMEGPIQFVDPLAVVELRLAIPVVTFPAPGEYRFQLFANNSFVMERRLVVLPIGGQSDAVRED